MYNYDEDQLHLRRKKTIFDKFGDIVDSTFDIRNCFLEFEKAHQFVLGLNISRQREWFDYCRSGKSPSYIPSNPYKTYRGNGWISWRHWLTNKMEGAQ